jgi:hypothetical protein
MSYLRNMFGMGDEVTPEQGSIRYFGSPTTGVDGSVRQLTSSAGMPTAGTSVAVTSPPIMAPISMMPPTPAPAAPDVGMQIPTPILIGGAALALYFLFKKG